MGGKRSEINTKFKLKPNSAAETLGRGKFVLVQGRKDAVDIARRVRAQGGKAEVQDKDDVLVKISGKEATFEASYLAKKGLYAGQVSAARRFS
jgi:hypothetical protein